MFILSLLSSFSFGNFFRGPFGKLAIYVGIAVISIIGFQFWLHKHDNALRQTVLIEFNQQQAEKTKEMQDEYNRKLKKLEDQQSAAVVALEEEMGALQRQRDTLISAIRSGNFDGGDSSELLRETIRLLGEQ